jgi:hypothetical protein
VVDDVKSNWVRDDELELREAVLKFRGSEKEDSEGSWLMVGVVVVIVGSRIALLS